MAPPPVPICGPGLPHLPAMMPGPSQPLAERDPNVGSVPSPAASGKKKATKRASPSAKADKDHVYTVAELSDIQLDGEEDETVPIFDTCDDVRKKLNEHIARPGVTKAGLTREFTEMLPNSKVTPRNLDAFLKMKGPQAGGHNNVFYAGFVFFEKIRVKQGKKKSAKRQKLEEVWAAKGGFPREGSHNKHYWCIAGEKPWLNYLGQLEIRGTPRRGPITSKKPSR